MAKKASTDKMAGQISMGTADKVVPTEYLATAILSLDKTAEDGQVVEVRVEPDNPADSNAVAIYVGDDKIGYLANKATTVRPNTKAAATWNKMVSSKKTAATYALLTNPQTITSGKTELTSFQASLYFVPKRKDPEKPKVITFKTYGGGVSAPGRKALLDKLKAGDKKDVKVELRQASAGSYIECFLADGSDPEVVGIVSTPESEDVEAQEAFRNLSAKILSHTSKVVADFTLVGTGAEVSLTMAGDDTSEIEAAIDRVIARCVEQANVLEAKVSMMRKANIPGSIICKVLDGHIRYPEPYEAMIPSPKYPFVDSSDTDPVLLRALAYHLQGKHIRLVGEKGSGKNTLIETVDWLLRRPLFRLSGNADMDKTDIIGSRTLVDGSMTYELTDFLKVLEIGGDVDMDECNTIKPDVELIIHSLTDDARCVNVPGYGKVSMGPGATFWMTMNEDYIGTSDMNDATVDRFVTIRLQSPGDIKPVLKVRCPNAADSDIEFCQKVYGDMLRSVQSGDLSSTCISIRGFIDALDCTDYLPLPLSLLDTLAGKPQDVSERKAIETIIENLGNP